MPSQNRRQNFGSSVPSSTGRSSLARYVVYNACDGVLRREKGLPVCVFIASSVRWDSTSASQHDRSIHSPGPPERTDTSAAHTAMAADNVPSSLAQLV